MNLLLMRRCMVKNNNKEWRVILHSFHNNQMKTDFCDKSHNVGWYKRKGLGALVWPITFNRIVEKNWSLLSSLAGVNSSYRTVHAMNVYMDLGIASEYYYRIFTFVRTNRFECSLFWNLDRKLIDFFMTDF